MDKKEKKKAVQKVVLITGAVVLYRYFHKKNTDRIINTIKLVQHLKVRDI